MWVYMTFRPSDDVLDEIANGQSPSFSGEEYIIPNQNEWEHIFNRPEDQWDSQSSWEESMNSFAIDIPTEEVKAPDLSELLKNSWGENTENNAETNLDNPQNNQPLEQPIQQTEIVENTPTIVQTTESVEQTVPVQTPVQETSLDSNTPQLGNEESQGNNIAENPQTNDEQADYVDENKLSDADRVKLVSSIEWSINSNLDYLVDRKWSNIIKKYKIINRLFFRRWIFVFAVIIGILGWVMLQVKANNSNNIQMVNDSSIWNKSKWIEETSDKKLSSLSEKGVDIDVIVPYGSVSIDWENFQSKSNLIKYKWIILPQLVSLNYNSQDDISLEDFNAKKTTREDIKHLIELLITNDSIYRKTTNLPNVEDSRWIGNEFQSSLMEWFSLWCLDSDKVSDFVCDRFLDSFNVYGKYFNLSHYSSELLGLIKNIKKQNKDIEPICNMVKEYTIRAGVVSETLISVMEYCWDDYNPYRKMVNFIDLENSLKQPELPEKVYDDPDLNAYKLLSAQQSVHKILDGTSLNENYIKSYLKYVQNLINKDSGKNHYLPAIYKDLLYVFNTDELYQKLMQKWKLSSDLKIQLDQINNWNTIYWYSSLVSQLTTTDIVKQESSYTGKSTRNRSIEDIFAQYYTMKDRLTIKSANKLSEDRIKVLTQVSSDQIGAATNGKSLPVTVILYKDDNVLYVENIKVANQRNLSEILNLYASEWNTTFYEMLSLIDKEVWMNYETAPKKSEDEPTLCDNLMWKDDINIYDCSAESIILYKWDVEYNFTFKDWSLESFRINDEKIDIVIREKLNWTMFTKYNTPTIITSIIDFNVENNEDDDDIEKKLSITDQFRIHFKLAPEDIQSIKWKPDDFIVSFTLWDFKLQGNYNINTHLLTKISYANCPKPLEIKQLSIEITAENEPQLIEISNNPKVFFVNANPTVYKKYQKTCLWN